MRLGCRPGIPPLSPSNPLTEASPAVEAFVPKPLAENAAKVEASREAGSKPRLEIEFPAPHDGCWPEPDPVEEAVAVRAGI